MHSTCARHAALDTQLPHTMACEKAGLTLTRHAQNIFFSTQNQMKKNKIKVFPRKQQICVNNCELNEPRNPQFVFFFLRRWRLRFFCFLFSCTLLARLVLPLPSHRGLRHIRDWASSSPPTHLTPGVRRHVIAKVKTDRHPDHAPNDSLLLFFLFFYLYPTSINFFVLFFLFCYVSCNTIFSPHFLHRTRFYLQLMFWFHWRHTRGAIYIAST